ncbi:MAG: hypothetical protein ACTID3_08650 [Halomonas sp.]|uniref:hypothetical protein n=1 Tax=Halomonas sp. TaxID=1486246 RepID=UPI003F8F7D40
MQQESAALEAIKSADKALPELLKEMGINGTDQAGKIYGIQNQISTAIKDLDNRLKALEAR